MKILVFIHWLVKFSGVVSFYKDFLESLNEFLDGNASIMGMAARATPVFRVLLSCVQLVCFLV